MCVSEVATGFLTLDFMRIMELTTTLSAHVVSFMNTGMTQTVVTLQSNEILVQSASAKYLSEPEESVSGKCETRRPKCQMNFLQPYAYATSGC